MVSYESRLSREAEPIADTESCPVHMPCALEGIGSCIYGSSKSFTQQSEEPEDVTMQAQAGPED